MTKGYSRPVGYGHGKSGAFPRNDKQKASYEASNGNAGESAFNSLRSNRRKEESKWPESQNKRR